MILHSTLGIIGASINGIVGGCKFVPMHYARYVLWSFINITDSMQRSQDMFNHLNDSIIVITFQIENKGSVQRDI